MSVGPDLHEIKEQTRRTWSLGDYPQVAARQLEIAEELCAAARLAPGERVLDLATATGNVALAAARRGAVATGVDLTPRMLELARLRATSEGLEVTFVEGDIEDVPVAGGSFDVALSACGVWFAPRPEVAVRELRRVLRPGGRVGLANFTPDGYPGRVNEIVTRWLPLPLGLPEPNEWGRPDVARSRLEGPFTDIECRKADLRYRFASASGATEFFASHSPPHVAAGLALEPAAARAMFEEIEAYTAETCASDGAVEVEATYLVVVAIAV